jgi:uncharacterized membrane protein
MTLGVTTYEFSLFIHITAAVAGLGATFVESLTYPIALRLGRAQLPFKHQLQLAINLTLALPALVVLLATGLYQTSEGGFDLGDFWLSGALAIVVVLALLVVAYFVPEDRRLLAMLERDLASSRSEQPAISDEYRRRVRIEAAMGVFADLLVIAAVYLMVTKPGL